MLPHPLTNFWIQRYYQNESSFNGAYSRNNLPNRPMKQSNKIKKDWAYVINLEQYADTGTHWIVLYLLGNGVIYFDSFAIEHIPKGTKKFIRN